MRAYVKTLALAAPLALVPIKSVTFAFDLCNEVARPSAFSFAPPSLTITYPKRPRSIRLHRSVGGAFSFFPLRATPFWLHPSYSGGRTPAFTRGPAKV